MTQVTDSDLLAQFARKDSNSEAAFATLVERYLGLVYSLALRHTANPQHAEDITQAVFIILARKAGNLGHKTILPGWLYHTARLTAANWQRAEARRFRREQEVFMQSTQAETAPDPVWLELSPQLDVAMAQLGAADRDALVLRYFQNKSLAEVGAALGLQERAAQKRVSRALDKLREFFSRRGIVLSAAAVAAAVSANSVQAAPPVLAKTIATVAVAKGTAASASTLTLVKGALKIMAWTKAKTVVAVGACVLFTAGTAVTLVIGNQGKPIHGIPEGWTVISGNLDQWNATNGVIYNHTVDGDSILVSKDEYRDVTISAVVGTTNREASLAFRMQDSANGYILNFVPPGTAGEPNGFVRLRKRTANDETTLAAYQGRGLSAAGYSAKITAIVKGPWIEVRLNDVTVFRTKDTTFSSGLIGLRTYGWADYPCDATYSNLTFY
jgi:RNA polymerase sigma factor (sigma-70 family)